jgi:predicted nucleic acid-binding Zn ribbon protein
MDDWVEYGDNGEVISNFVVIPHCFTCGATDKPLDRAGFCSNDCKDIADFEADKAAEHLYSYDYQIR